MSDHDCEKCYQYDACTHVREDVTVFDPISEYLYYITYVGGYAVLTTKSTMDWQNCTHNTMVVCVGRKSLGDILDSPKSEQRSRILHEQFHSWEYAVDTHDFIVLGLNEKMLVLSE